MAVLERWYLTNTLAGHNKFYEVVVDGVGGGHYEVKAKYGKVGSSGKFMTKYKGNNMNAARNVAGNLVREKEGRGYVQRSNVPVAPTKLSPKGKDAQASIALDRFVNLE
jgi:predicted DNA-binding WGR domain protein